MVPTNQNRLGRKEPNNDHYRFVDTETGELQERRLQHGEEAEKFYRDVAGQGMRVRVGMEASGHARRFERMLAELNFELWIGDAAEISTKRVRKQKTDRQDAQLILRLLLEDRFPQIRVPSWENRDLRQLLWHRHRDSLMLTANRRGPELRATNGELVKVSSLDGGAIRLEDGRTLPANYHEFTHGYAVTAHRSQGKTVDTVIISADAMKKELFYVAASRGRSEIAVVTSDREQLRESVGVSAMRQSAIELARKQLSAHDPENGHRVDLMTGVNRQAASRSESSILPFRLTHRYRKGLLIPASTVISEAPVLVSGFEVSRRPHLHIPHMAEKCRG